MLAENFPRLISSKVETNQAHVSIDKIFSGNKNWLRYRGASNKFFEFCDFCERLKKDSLRLSANRRPMEFSGFDWSLHKSKKGP